MSSPKKFEAIEGALFLCLLPVLIGCSTREPLEEETRACPVSELASLDLVVHEDFESSLSHGTVRFSDPAAWSLIETEDSTSLAQHKQSVYKPPHRSPINIGLLPYKTEGSFVLEADLMQTGREYAHRDMCIFFCFERKERFGYAHISQGADGVAHHILVVDDSDREPITSRRNKGVDWGKDAWHRVRVVFHATTKRMEVFFDDMQDPVLVSNEIPLSGGYLGFGTFDDVGRVDNVSLWAEKATEEPASFFAPFSKEEKE